MYLAAAKVGGILANQNHPVDFLYRNLMIQSNVIRAAYAAGRRKLLFLGSSCIYPREAPQPLREDALLTGPLESTNEPYAIAKIAGLKLCEAYQRQHGARFICAMPTNLYGPRDNYDLHSSHVLPALIRKFHEGREAGQASVTIWGTGAPLREFLYVDDLARACVMLMEHPDATGIYNIGAGQDIAIAELATLVARVVGFRGAIDYDRSKPDGTPRKLMDSGRIRALGWRPEISLAHGIELAYGHFCGSIRNRRCPWPEGRAREDDRQAYRCALSSADTSPAMPPSGAGGVRRGTGRRAGRPAPAVPAAGHGRLRAIFHDHRAGRIRQRRQPGRGRHGHQAGVRTRARAGRRLRAAGVGMALISCALAVVSAIALLLWLVVGLLARRHLRRRGGHAAGHAGAGRLPDPAIRPAAIGLPERTRGLPRHGAVRGFQPRRHHGAGLRRGAGDGLADLDRAGAGARPACWPAPSRCSCSRAPTVMLLRPVIDRPAMMAAFRFSRWSWLNSLSALAFGSVDRVLVGGLMGPAALAIYTVGVQVGQMIHTASVAVFQKPCRASAGAGGAALSGAAEREVRRQMLWNLALFAGATLAVPPAGRCWT